MQTGEFAGPLGSGIGQLQFAQGLTVREEQPAQALYTPRFGLFEVRLRAIADPANMVALWMIGFEDAPERSGEILVCEIFGADMTGTTARVAMGVRRWADPALEDDVEQVPLEIDAREPHWYAAQWLPDRVAFYVDERLIRSVARAPTYPMQFMLSLYELADGPGLGSGLDRYPKVAVVERFRGWRPVTGDGARPPAFP